MEFLSESMESFRKAAGSLSEMAQVHGGGAVLKSPGPRITDNATKSFTEASRNLHGISLSFF